MNSSLSVITNDDDDDDDDDDDAQCGDEHLIFCLQDIFCRVNKDS